MFIISEGGTQGTLIEVALESRSADDSRHRRDIETEQTAANNGDGRDHVDVTHDDHDGWSTVIPGIKKRGTEEKKDQQLEAPEQGGLK